MKDYTPELEIAEIVGLRSKLYAYKLDNVYECKILQKQ